MGTVSLPKRFLASDPLEKEEDWVDADDPEADWLRKEQQELLVDLGFIAIENNKPVCKRRWSRSLIEVFSVRLIDSSPEHLDQVYGTIRVGVFGKTCTIFKRHIGDGQSRPFFGEGYARLSGEDGPIDDDDGIFIFPALYKKNDTSHLFHPNKSHMFLSCGYFKREYFEMMVSESERPGIDGECLCYSKGIYEICYDQLVCRQVSSLCGPLEVCYAVYKDGAEAFLFLKLIEFEGEGEGGNTSIEVYGEVHASNTMLSDPRAKSVLFDRKSDDRIIIMIGDNIPLSKSVVVVPFASKLIIQVHLMFHCTVSGSVVTGTATAKFPARCCRPLIGNEIAEEIIVTGTGCKFQVKAAWSPFWASSDFDEVCLDEE